MDVLELGSLGLIVAFIFVLKWLHRPGPLTDASEIAALNKNWQAPPELSARPTPRGVGLTTYGMFFVAGLTSAWIVIVFCFFQVYFESTAKNVNGDSLDFYLTFVVSPFLLTLMWAYLFREVARILLALRWGLVTVGRVVSVNEDDGDKSVRYDFLDEQNTIRRMDSFVPWTAKLRSGSTVTVLYRPGYPRQVTTYPAPFVRLKTES